MKKIIFSLLIGGLIFTSCNKVKEHSHVHGENCEHSHDHDHDHTSFSEEAHEHIATDENPNAISFSESQQQKIDFEIVFPKMERFGQVIKSTAQILSSQTDESMVSAKASGVVVFQGSDWVSGKAVDAGQQLLTISGTGLSENNAEARFAEIKARYEKAKAAYQRAEALIEDRIISQKEFLEISAEYETSKALYDNVVRNFSSKGQRISSPITGFIREIYVSNGEYVEEGQLLMTVSKNRKLLLKADLQPKYNHLLPFISSAVIRSANGRFTFTLEELNGKLLSFGKSLTDENYLIPVTFQVDNKPDFITGGLVEIYIKIKSDKEIMTIPHSAITEEQGAFFVYVQLCPESFEKREIAIGQTDGVRTEVRSGLELTERIVSKGAISVKLAQSSGSLDPHAGHVH